MKLNGLHVVLVYLMLLTIRGDAETAFEKNSQNEFNDSPCPTWYRKVHENGETWCVCNGTIIQDGLVIRCPKRDRICLKCKDQQEEIAIGRDDLNVSILSSFCMTHNFSTNQTLLALCPYNRNRVSSDFNFFVTMPSNLSDLNRYMCDSWHPL